MVVEHCPCMCKRPVEPIEQCFCTAEWKPVCGSDEVTYSNSGCAKCAGVDFRDGPCRTTPEGCNSQTCQDFSIHTVQNNRP